MIYISRRDPSIDVLHLLYFVEVAKNKQICFCFCVFEHNKGFVGDDTTLVIGLILGVSRRNDHQVKMPYTKKTRMMKWKLYIGREIPRADCAVIRCRIVVDHVVCFWTIQCLIVICLGHVIVLIMSVRSP